MKQLIISLAVLLPGACYAQVTSTRVDLSPQAPVVLVKPSGRAIPYGVGAANAAAVGTALLAAQTASASGDLIYCRADATISAAIGKDGLRYEFAPGVGITHSQSLGQLISDGGSSISFEIAGGQWSSPETDGRGIYLTGATSAVVIHAESLTTDEVSIYTSSGGDVTAKFDVSLTSSTYDCIWLAGTGTIDVECPVVTAYDNVIEGGDQGGEVILRADRVTSTSGSTFNLTPETATDVIAREVTAPAAQYAIANGATNDTIQATTINGRISGFAGRLIGATVDSSAVAGSATIALATGDAPTLENCRVITHSGQTNSITAVAAETITIVGTLHFNKALSNITLASPAGNRSSLGVKVVQLQPFAPGDTVTTGDGKVYFAVPSVLSGGVITAVRADLLTASSSGAPNFDLTRIRSGTPVDVLSTNLTVDQDETTSADATTAAVINTSNDDLLTGDLIRLDVDTAGTSTAMPMITVEVTQ